MPLVIDPVTGEKRYKYPDSTTSQGGGGRETIELQRLLSRAGVEAPEPKPKFGFSNLLDTLNAPSKKTEEILTGGKGYEAMGASAPVAFGARMIADPLNFIPSTWGLKALKLAGKGIKATGKVKPIGRVGRQLEEMFVPGAKLKRVSPQLAEELPAFETATRAKQIQATRRVGELGKNWSPEIRANIGKLVERAGAGETLTSEEMKAVTEAKDFIQSNITTPEKVAGIAPKEIANYFPRKVERDAVAAQLKFGGPKLSVKLGGAEKARTHVTQVAGEEAGKVYKDALEALGSRVSRSTAAVDNKGFIERLLAGEVKDIDGNALFKPMAKGMELEPGNTLVRIDKDGLKVGDKFLGFYPTKNLKGKKIVGVTTRGANFQVPTEAADAVSKYYNTFTSDEATNGFLKLWDGVLGAWKIGVTVLYPAFHARNVLGNLSNMWLGGWKNPGTINDAIKIQRGGSIVAKGTTVTKDLAEQLGLVGRGQFGYDVPDVLRKVLGNETPLSKLDPRQWGAVLEENSKIAFFLDRLNKGDNIPQAVAQVKKYLFDYSSLTPFEKNFMKRVIPFYTWMRNNIPLQLESLITKPGQQAAIAKTFKNLSPLTEEEKEALPPNLTEGLSASLGENEEGELQVLSSLGLPFEDLGRLWRGSAGRTIEREALGSMGPLSNALGALVGKDFFRGKNIEDLAYTYGRAAKNYPDVLKNWLDFRVEKTKAGKEVYYVDPMKFAQLNILAPRIMRTLGEPGSAFNFARVTPVNLEEEKKRTQKRQTQEMEKELEKKGIIKKFEKSYIPRGTN